jgi:spore coat polysaccharide biosynthesis protein SpsF
VREGVLCITQARMGSSRLPGKVLREILGRPLLQYHMERLQRVSSIDQLVVATSTEAGDDAIEAFSAAAGVACFRGSEQDVLDRFYQCAKAYEADIILRVTSDCPLIDPAIIDLAIEAFRSGDYDYLSTDPTRYPRGMDSEICMRTALEAAWCEATDPAEREHVMPYLYRNPKRFRIGSFAEADAAGAEYRLCVDEEDDFRLVSAVLEALYPDNPEFGWRDVVAFLADRPELAAINAEVRQHVVT